MLRGRGGVDDALADFDRGGRAGALNETAAAYRTDGSVGVGNGCGGADAGVDVDGGGGVGVALDG